MDSNQMMQQKPVWKGHEALKKQMQKEEQSKVYATKRTMEEFDLQESRQLEKSVDMAKVLGVWELERLQGYGTEEEVTEAGQRLETLKAVNTKREEKKQKKDKQEQAATARMGEKHQYFNQQPEDMLNAQKTVSEEVKENRLKGKEVLNGNEFALNPENGELLLPIEEILRRREHLHTYIESNQDAVGDQKLIVDQYKIILEKMDGVLKLWYLANGVNMENGKSVGNMRKNSARKEFALALETYRDSVKNISKNIAEAKIEELWEPEVPRQIEELLRFREKMSSYIEKYKDNENVGDQWMRDNYIKMLPKLDELLKQWYLANGIDMKSGKSVGNVRKNHARKALETALNEYVDSAQKLELVEKHRQRLLPLLRFEKGIELVDNMQAKVDPIREMMREDNERYMESKELADKLYGEFLENAARIQKTSHEAWQLKGPSGNRLGDDPLLQIAYVEVNKNKEQIVALFEKQKQALAYLLKGEDADSLYTAVFLHETYGIDTPLYKNASEKYAEKKAKIESLRAEGLAEDKIDRIMFHADKVEQAKVQVQNLAEKLKERKSKVEEAGRNPDDDFEVQALSRAQKLAELKMGSSDTPSMNALLRVQELGKNSLQEMERKSMSDQLFSPEKNTYQTKDGKKITKYAQDAKFRDTVANLSSLNSPNDCSMERAEHFMENMAVLVYAAGDQSFVETAEREAAEVEIAEQIQTGELTEELREEKTEERTQERLKERVRLALAEELEMEREAKADIEQYVRAHAKAFSMQGNPSVEDCWNEAEVLKIMHDKVQGLEVRLNWARKSDEFQNLLQEQRDEFLELYGYIGAIRDYILVVFGHYDARTAKSKETEETPMESLEQRREARRNKAKEEQKERRLAWKRKPLLPELEREKEQNPYVQIEAVEIVRELNTPYEQKRRSGHDAYDALSKEGYRENTDIRLLTDLTKGYAVDAAGNPITEQDRLNKAHDERAIKAYYGTDSVLTKEFMAEKAEELLQTNVTEEMLSREYIIEHAIEMRYLARRFLIADNLLAPDKTAWNDLPAEKLDALSKIRNAMAPISVYIIDTLQAIGVNCNGSGYVIEEYSMAASMMQGNDLEIIKQMNCVALLQEGRAQVERYNQERA